jgi:hypothetical protein
MAKGRPAFPLPLPMARMERLTVHSEGAKTLEARLCDTVWIG